MVHHQYENYLQHEHNTNNANPITIKFQENSESIINIETMCTKKLK